MHIQISSILILISLLVNSTSASASSDYLLFNTPAATTNKELAGTFVLNATNNEEANIGGISVSQTNNAQLTQVNLLNYTLKLGDNFPIPFQLFISPSLAGSSTTNNPPESNQAKLMDPKSGTAIRFPVIYKIKGDGKGGICSFAMQTDGSCQAGADLTFSTKSVTDTSGSASSANQVSVNLGTSGSFPIFQQSDGIINMREGYLSAAFKVGYSHFSGVSDSTLLFNPVLDANGNPIKFDNSLKYYDVGVALVINKTLSLSAKWVGPIGGNDYLKQLFVISIEAMNN